MELLTQASFKFNLDRIIAITQNLHSIEENVHIDPYMLYDKQTADKMMADYRKIKVNITYLISKIMRARTHLIKSALHGDLQENQKAIQVYAKDYLSQGLSETVSLLAEYELNFLGIDSLRGTTFKPWFLKQLESNASDQDALLDKYLPAMSKNEDERRGYATDPHLDKNWSDDWELAHDTINKFLTGKKRVLEIGFWNKKLYHILKKFSPDLEYAAADFSSLVVQKARRAGLNEIYSANAIWTLPVPDESVDGIIMSTFIIDTELPSPEMKRVVKKGGEVLHFVMPRLQRVDFYPI